jgi:hypothetical protein
MNRKGDVPESLVEFMGYMAFVIVLVVFFFLFKLSGESKALNIKAEAFPEVTGQQFLLNYLRSPADYKGQKIMMAEYVASSYENGEKNQLKEKLSRDLDVAFRDQLTGCRNIIISDSKSQFVTATSIVTQTTSIEAGQKVQECKVISSVVIPTRKGEVLRVELG